ncbi:MAG TPA: hypothetical protein VFB99_24445 [Vicinamibacterales bacterium]|nr:hypothetical protein [Vicinamibacterales bacterium]
MRHKTGTVPVAPPWSPGDRVVHRRDPYMTGTVSIVEKNELSVMVRWDGDDEGDFQWSNKLVPLQEQR